MKDICEIRLKKYEPNIKSKMIRGLTAQQFQPTIGTGRRAAEGGELQAEPRSGEALHMASAKREPIKNGVQGRCPWSGVREAKPAEADNILQLDIHILH